MFDSVRHDSKPVFTRRLRVGVFVSNLAGITKFFGLAFSCSDKLTLGPITMSEAVHCYFLPPTRDAPNSRLPVLHYQDVLPFPRDEESAKVFLTAHEWEHRVRAAN